MSTIHNASCWVAKTKAGKEVNKQNAVLDYNHTMGGVDKADQEMTFYPITRKQQKRYYKKIFRYLLEQCMWNTFVLFRQHCDNATPIEHADFVLGHLKANDLVIL